jgi:hypothetical protein
MHAETLVEYPSSLIGSDGKMYLARACGRNRPDGLWEGWIEFEREDGEVAVRTTRETTQPNRTDLAYWASGLTAVYLEGAFRRATEGPPVVVVTEPDPPVFDGPAPRAVPVKVDAVLDPFDAFKAGEDALRARLNALASWHLRNIVLAYAILPDDPELHAMTKAQLVERIIGAARRAA